MLTVMYFTNPESELHDTGVLDLSPLYEDVSIDVVDIVEEAALADDWEVLGSPTFILVNDQGQEVDRKMGIVSLDWLKHWINVHRV